MNKKIHNNLNIDNLMRTEMFNQFDEIQQKKIKIGLEKGLNVSVYAKSEFDWPQMEQIGLGLEDNLDVSIYANSKYNWKQMYYLKLIKNVKNDIKHKEIYN